MIIGIGTDIVEIDRMAQALARHGERFAERILCPWELEQFSDSPHPAAFLAKRFAAKEAFAKALGTGYRDGLVLGQVGVTHTSLGQPQLNLSGRAAELAGEMRVAHSHLSLADERHYAIAFVTLTDDNG